MQTEPTRGEKPPIILLDSEADALADLAHASLARSSLAARLLLEEIDRATTASPADMPADVVTMRSQVEFVDEASGETHAVRLVYPHDADMEQHRLSVLTPVGAGLIGMRCGDAIEWPNRAGTFRRLRIVGVVQPERDQ
jgi:regulator of nucleoside diphosphate kinase